MVDMVNELLVKLNYKDFPRICVLNADKTFTRDLKKALKGKQVDKMIDPRFLYDFIIIFTYNVSDIEELVPDSIHNLSEDGILWVAYPKKSSPNFVSDISRDTGWGTLKTLGYKGVRQISINDDLSALRFRNAKFVKRRKDRQK